MRRQRRPLTSSRRTDLVDERGDASEYIPLLNKALEGSGQKRLVFDGNTLAIVGDPPKARIVISVFESTEKAQVVDTSLAYLEAKNVGDKFAKVRAMLDFVTTTATATQAVKPATIYDQSKPRCRLQNSNLRLSS
jgi:uncharacterized protein (DUF1330 family)